MVTRNSDILRQLPSVNECLSRLSSCAELEAIPASRIKHCVRYFLEQFRQSIFSGANTESSTIDIEVLFKQLVTYIQGYHRPRFSKVINASGVIVHTNLGRSLLPESSIAALMIAAAGSSNLELNLATGRRGSRYAHVEDLLCELTGAEAAMVVNNNAAAVLIALETLGQGKEVIVSRGQLVEIGGSFRIPDIMARSGAHLVEVGATNRTHLTDYEAAITGDTALLLRVHCSNYRIIGFTREVSAADLVRLGNKHQIMVMEDLGSGCLIDLSPFGLAKEPLVQDVVASGMDIVTFSGDKLLGGPQAGIIVGAKSYVDRIKCNPLNRALRIDKLTLASLEAVLRLYLDESQAVRDIPTLAMIAAPELTLHRRASHFCVRCQQLLDDVCVFAPIAVNSQVGGGALPEQNLRSWAVSLMPKQLKISQLEKKLRSATIPVIGRVEKDCLLLDMRTVAEKEENTLFNSLREAFAASP